MPTTPGHTPPSQVASVGPTGTLADVLAKLQQDPGLSAARRQQYAGALRTICAIIGRPPTAIPRNLPVIEQMLGGVPNAVHGRSRKTIANARSALKAALARDIGTPKLPPRGTALHSDWAELHRRLVDLRLKNGLTRLMRVASYHGIAPDEMSDDAMQQIVDIVRSANWGRDALPFHRQSVQLWNEAAATVNGWPSAPLTPPPKLARPAHLQLTAFPPSFRSEVEAYLNWAAGADFLAVDAPATRLAPSTITLRRNQLRIAASALARHLGDPAHVTTLAALVQPEHAKQILMAFLPAHAQDSPSAFVRGLATTLVTVARQWVKPDSASLSELRRLQQRLGRPSTGLTAKNRNLMRQLEDPRLLRKLLILPDGLRKQAVTARLSPSRRLQKVQLALAIDLLLVAPMRLRNLAMLQLDRQVVWPTGREGTVYITLTGHETKNDQPLEYPLSDGLRDALHDYLDRFRRHSKGANSSWLFVRPDGTPVPPATLRDGITKAITREVGVHVTPHQFRHLAAAITLEAQPDALGMVKDLLGHKSLKTTQNFYAGMRTRQAGRAYDAILFRKRSPQMNWR